MRCFIYRLTYAVVKVLLNTAASTSQLMLLESSVFSMTVMTTLDFSQIVATVK